MAIDGKKDTKTLPLPFAYRPCMSPLGSLFGIFLEIGGRKTTANATTATTKDRQNSIEVI